MAVEGSGLSFLHQRFQETQVIREIASKIQPVSAGVFHGGRGQISASANDVVIPQSRHANRARNLRSKGNTLGTKVGWPQA